MSHTEGIPLQWAGAGGGRAGSSPVLGYCVLSNGESGMSEVGESQRDAG